MKLLTLGLPGPRRGRRGDEQETEPEEAISWTDVQGVRSGDALQEPG